MTKRKLKTSMCIVGLRCYVVLEDIMAGKRNRFTVHQISLVGQKKTKVVAREVTAGVAKKVIQRLEPITEIRGRVR